MLRRLTETDGISGYEQPLSELIQTEIQPCVDTLEVDGMGNLICYKAGSIGEKTVIVTAPMDEVGLIVTQITDEGYLKFDTVGTLKPDNLVSKRIKINGHSGVISFKAIHLTTKEERKQPVKPKDLFIDIGAASKEEAEALALPGDYCAFDSEFVEFGSQMMKAKAAGTRAACYALMETLKHSFRCNVIAVFTAQNGIGYRGLETAAYRVLHNYRRADAALLLSAAEAKKPYISLGSGPVLSLHYRDGLLNAALKDQILDSAEMCHIPVQLETDQNTIPLLFDCPSAVLSIPCRNCHSAWELIQKTDLEAWTTLINKWIKEV